MIKPAIILFFLLLIVKPVMAQTDLARKLNGRILLQVENRGQAWYVNPADLKRYYLGRPNDAFSLMRRLGIGITNQDLARLDDQAFAKINAGKIFLQVQSAGQAWYVNPLDLKKHYLGRPADAFNLMRSLALGIKNSDINNISIGYLSLQTSPASPPSSATPSPVTAPTDQVKRVIDSAASAIRSGNTASVVNYFTPEMKNLTEYTMNVLDDDGRLFLGNLLSDTKLKSSSDTEKIYSAEVYVAIVGRKVEAIFKVKKQADGSWLIANL
ncbi:MAG: hypothetical protein Q8O93_04805 [bacterium]|nr:hypothetical protein [bacterium]